MNGTIPMTQPATQTARRGFASLLCILCGNADGNVSVSLEDVSQFHCAECGDDFDADAVRQQMGQWQTVLDWCEAAPTLE